MMKTILIAATAMALAAPALAQQPPGSQPVRPSQPAIPAQPDDATEAQFMKADADKNGALTMTEAKVLDATVTQADFDRFDSDKDKALSKAEFSKWAMAKKANRDSAPGQ